MCRLIPYESHHADGVIAVVRAVHDEHGFTWEADGYHKDLYDVDRHYLLAGMFWTLVDGERIIGCVGVTLHGGECELHRLYLLQEYRGRGLGRKMLDESMTFGRAKGCHRMIAWSDVKLGDAHALYRKVGFVQEGERICDDPDESHEYGFWKEPL
jgi:putative acetyltransferase